MYNFQEILELLPQRVINSYSVKHLKQIDNICFSTNGLDVSFPLNRITSIEETEVTIKLKCSVFFYVTIFKNCDLIMTQIF
jgi:hypothetical protein